MLYKSFVISILLIGIVLLGMVGCGDDEEKPNKPTVEPTVTEPMSLNEDLIGSWQILSINDESPLTFINADEPDEEDRPKINVEKFTYSYAEDGSWTLKLDAEMFDFPEDPDPTKEGKIEITEGCA